MLDGYGAGYQAITYRFHFKIHNGTVNAIFKKQYL